MEVSHATDQTKPRSRLGKHLRCLNCWWWSRQIIGWNLDEGETFAVRVRIGRTNPTDAVFRSRYLIAASGIIDNLPKLADMQNVFDYAGHNLHVCLICDGYEMRDKRAGVFGSSESSLEVAFPLGWFTPDITLFTNGEFAVSPEFRARLTAHGYRLVEQPIQRFLGENHQMSGVELADGSVVALDAGLVSMGSKYHADYLKNIDLEYQGGNLMTDKMNPHKPFFGWSLVG